MLPSRPPQPGLETNSPSLHQTQGGSFGKHPDELAAALKWNRSTELIYRRLGATIIDGTLPPSEVADAILASAAAISPRPQ